LFNGIATKVHISFSNPIHPPDASSKKYDLIELLIPLLISSSSSKPVLLIRTNLRLAISMETSDATARVTKIAPAAIMIIISNICNTGYTGIS
jgi:hypothetical protein